MGVPIPIDPSIVRWTSSSILGAVTCFLLQDHLLSLDHRFGRTCEIYSRFAEGSPDRSFQLSLALTCGNDMSVE